MQKNIVFRSVLALGCLFPSLTACQLAPLPQTGSLNPTNLKLNETSSSSNTAQKTDRKLLQAAPGVVYEDGAMVSTVAGPAGLWQPTLIACDNPGNIYFTDRTNNSGIVTEDINGTLKRISPNGTLANIHTSAPLFSSFFIIDNLTFDANGDAQFKGYWENSNHDWMYCRVNPQGIFSIVKQGECTIFSGDCTEYSRLSSYDATGGYYEAGFIEYPNIGKIVYHSRLGISTVVANGDSYIATMTVGPDGACYFVAQGHDNLGKRLPSNVVYKVSQTGQLTLLAGNLYEGGYIDAQGEGARLTNITGIAVDDKKNVFVCGASSESFDKVSYIRKISPTGAVTTIAGGNPPGFQDGPGRNSQFGYISPHLTIDKNGVLYLSDPANNRIRKIDFTSFEADGGLAIGDKPCHIEVRSNEKWTLSADWWGTIASGEGNKSLDWDGLVNKGTEDEMYLPNGRYRLRLKTTTKTHFLDLPVCNLLPVRYESDSKYRVAVVPLILPELPVLLAEGWVFINTARGVVLASPIAAKTYQRVVLPALIRAPIISAELAPQLSETVLVGPGISAAIFGRAYSSIRLLTQGVKGQAEDFTYNYWLASSKAAVLAPRAERYQMALRDLGRIKIWMRPFIKNNIPRRVIGKPPDLGELEGVELYGGINILARSISSEKKSSVKNGFPTLEIQLLRPEAANFFRDELGKIFEKIKLRY